MLFRENINLPKNSDFAVYGYLPVRVPTHL